jgi:hypothetical protein
MASRRAVLDGGLLVAGEGMEPSMRCRFSRS